LPAQLSKRRNDSTTVKPWSRAAAVRGAPEFNHSGAVQNMVGIFVGIITREAMRRGNVSWVDGPHRRRPLIERRIERALLTVRLDPKRRGNRPPGRNAVNKH